MFYYYNPYPPQSPLTLVKNFAAFNPHTRFTINDSVFDRTMQEWPKWKTYNPTSPHWYTVEALRGLIAAYLTHEMDSKKKKTVREFVSEFRGLSSTIKQKKVTEGFHGVYLADLVDDKDISMKAVETLLERMQAETKGPYPRKLGVIGEEHAHYWMTVHGGSSPNIHYEKKMGFENNIPYVYEYAQAVGKKDSDRRTMAIGLNWTPSLGQPIDLIAELLGEVMNDRRDPLVIFSHLAMPALAFTDRGKTRAEI